MSSEQELQDLYNVIKYRVPDLKIEFKDESRFMKIIGKLLFFNPKFMTNYVTAIGKTIYFPNVDFIKNSPRTSYKIMCHEYVHILDSMKKPIRYNIGYLMPQIFFVFSFLSFLAFFNLWFLLFLLCLAPIPSPWRTKYELRGYGMSCKVDLWKGKILQAEQVNDYIEKFTSKKYYFMCRSRDHVKKELYKYIYTDDCLKDDNQAYKDVYANINT